MHIYKGYQYEPYKGSGSEGAGQRQETATSREELERRYAESLAKSSSGAPKPQRDLLPFAIVLLALLVGLACIGAWMFYGYDMTVPMLAMQLVLVGGYVGWRMM